MYSDGTGVNKSLTRSLKLLRKAAGGNIPGTDAEIARVEAELAQLQEQYLTEQEKQKVLPIVVLPVKKAITSSPTPPKIKTKRIKPTKTAKKKTTAKTKTVKKETKVKKQPIKLVSTKTPVKKAPPKPEIKVPPHPMDMICGGRNRFSRNCR